EQARQDQDRRDEDQRAPVYAAHRQLPVHPRQYEHPHSDRGTDERQLDHDDHDDPEPDRVEAERLERGQEDRDRDHHHGERVHDRAEEYVHGHDQQQDEDWTRIELADEACEVCRQLRDGKEVVEDERPQDDREQEGRDLAGVDQAAPEALPVHLAAQPRNGQGAQGAYARGFRRTEDPDVHPADHDDEQQHDPADGAQRQDAFLPAAALDRWSQVRPERDRD